MKKLTRQLLVFALTLMMAISLLGGTAFAAGEDEAVTVDIFHTNDVHSRIANYPLISGYIGAAKEAGNVLLLDAGDTLHGQTIATLAKGESIVKIMNAMAYDAMTPGNHDFNYGIDRLFELEKLMEFPLLSSNVTKDGKTAFAPSVILESGGFKIAVIGVSTPETAYKTHPNNVKGYSFDDPVASVKAAVEAVKDEADAIVVLAHVGLDEASVDKSSDIAEQVEGIDVIIDGHSHSLLPEGKLVGNTLIASTGEYGANLGHVSLTFESGELTVAADLIDIAALAEEGGVEPDTAITDIIAEIEESQSAIKSEVVGKTDVELVGERAIVRAGASNLGNLITASMILETGADIAFTNGGGIRASIPVGDITRGDVITVLPFGNYIITKEIKGSDIIAALELGFSAYPEPLGGFPHFDGMKVTFDAGKPVGSRVVSVFVGESELDPDATYVFATNDFMAAGGDEYTMFADYPILNEYGALDEALINYLADGGEIPEMDDRLTIIEAKVAEPTPEPEPAPAPEPEPAPAPEPEPVPAPAPAPAPAAGSSYTVVLGDNLTKIADNYGTTWRAIYELNKNIIKDPNLIYPGQQLVLP